MKMRDPGHCPNCHSTGLTPFYEVTGSPVHSVLLMETRREAVNYPTGDIRLALCEVCGFICNIAFDPALHEYSAKYEATQSYSPTFNRFHRNLANRLIERYDLRNRDIIEIGCGQGEFLILLCEMGPNRGVGFDPAYRDYPLDSEARDRITFIADFYSEKYSKYHGDFVCCKMTLEHIPQTAEFVTNVRRSIGDRTNTVVFFQVPNASYVMSDIAFWDIYYEHCSYFTTGSLSRLFRQCGFEVLDLAAEYDDQYIMIEARPSNGPTSAKLEQENDLADTTQIVNCFAANYREKLAGWQATLQNIKKNKQRAVIWGGGSKGVSFLTALNVTDEVGYAVDINPHKHGTFMAGTGHEIVSPEFLSSYKPDVVIVMNPVYRDEIQECLNEHSPHSNLVSV
jgi:SAM-dependent methyltransferase